MPAVEFLLSPLTGGCAAALLAGCGLALLIKREPLSRRGRALMGVALLLAAAYTAAVAFLLWMIVGFSGPN